MRMRVLQPRFAHVLLPIAARWSIDHPKLVNSIIAD